MITREQRERTRPIVVVSRFASGLCNVVKKKTIVRTVRIELGAMVVGRKERGLNVISVVTTPLDGVIFIQNNRLKTKVHYEPLYKTIDNMI